MDGDELSQHLIYHPSSPGFDIPDYLPPLRRVKPLPKRKRSSPDPARSLPLNAMLPSILPPPPGPDATAAELIAHAEVLSAQIALQSYFLPTALGGSGGGVVDLTTAMTASTPTNNTTTATATATRRGGEMPLTVEPQQQLSRTLPPADLDVVVTPSSGDGREGDHSDHTQQQGNAKKRKVPAHLSGSQMGPDSADVHSSEEELQLPQKQHLQSGDRVLAGFASHGVVASAGAGGASEEESFGVAYGAADGRGGKHLPATMVGLRQKQVLKHRRRQLAALLGSPSPTALGDSHSLALDQALLANNHMLLNENRSGVSGSIGTSRNARLVKSRLIRRRSSRAVRRHRTLPPLARSEPTCPIFPDGEFTFLSSNAGVSFGVRFFLLFFRSVCSHPTVLI